MLHPELVGTVALRNGGHIMIPEEALEKMGLTDGDELVVFVGGLKKRLILTQPGTLEESFDSTIKQLQGMKKVYDAEN